MQNGHLRARLVKYVKEYMTIEWTLKENYWKVKNRHFSSLSPHMALSGSYIPYSPGLYKILHLLPRTYNREGLILERGLLFWQLTFYCQNEENNLQFFPLNTIFESFSCFKKQKWHFKAQYNCFHNKRMPKTIIFST